MLVKSKIKQAFASAAESYDDVAALQRQAGRTLLQQVGVVPQNAVLLDLGCGTGFMLAEMINQQQKLPTFSIALDIAGSMLHIAQQKLIEQRAIAYLCADAEQLPLQNNSVDAVVSNLALQWCRTIESTLANIHRILKPDGTFGFTTFGTQTLKELRQAWQEIDSYQHVNNFYQADDISLLLTRAGFVVVNVKVVKQQIDYPSVVDLMMELKQLGAHTVMNGNNPRLTGKAAMQRMKSAYERQMDSGLITATFEVITVIANRAS